MGARRRRRRGRGGGCFFVFFGAIADEIGVSRMTVLTWRRRFAAKRFDGLDDEPRCGAPRKIGDDKIADVVTQTLETMPSHATHWSTRSMAKASGLSVSTVHRIWNAFSLQPHRSETFKLSTDPRSKLVGVPRAFGVLVGHLPSAILSLPAFVSRSPPDNSCMYPSWISRSLCSAGIVRCIKPLAQSRNETNSSWVNGADKSGFIFQICASGAAVQASHPATIKLTHYRAFGLDV